MPYAKKSQTCVYFVCIQNDRGKCDGMLESVEALSILHMVFGMVHPFRLSKSTLFENFDANCLSVTMIVCWILQTAI